MQRCAIENVFIYAITTWLLFLKRSFLEFERYRLPSTFSVHNFPSNSTKSYNYHNKHYCGLNQSTQNHVIALTSCHTVPLMPTHFVIIYYQFSFFEFVLQPFSSNSYFLVRVVNCRGMKYFCMLVHLMAIKIFSF